MKFFGIDNPSFDPESNSHLIIYILSLLDNRTRDSSVFVSKEWNKLVNLTKKYLDLLPTIHRVPLFKTAGLDVLRLKLLAGGMTNNTYRVGLQSNPEQWVLRIPGIGSSAFITRENEDHNAHQAEKLGLNVPIVFFDPIDGLQVTSFIPDIKNIDSEALERKDILSTVAKLLHSLHSSPPFLNNTSFFERNEDLLNVLKKKQFSFNDDISFIEKHMLDLKSLFNAYPIEMHPCHNDATPLNFIMSFEGSRDDKKEKIHIIDWEYSSNNHILWDLVYFSVEAKLNKQQELFLLNSYFGEKLTKTILAWFELYKPIITWWITIWSWSQLANKANAVELTSYEKLGKENCQKTLTYLNSEEYTDAFQSVAEEKEMAKATGHSPF